MSQAKLTLRPPPNVEFVQGYPGIPPGAPDRLQAAVKGEIEVRVAPQGVKAKWVRVELRKAETLPGGGVTNTFFDPVGQSPLSVWQATEEYGTLTAQDFPFYIRIPESIPPSLALEKGAGVKYELIATVCIKGKKGLFRRDKPTITATSAPIIIDKHELHSTWPVYTQPESRQVSQEGVQLTIDRTHTCYGPGDRIVVMATVKPDSFHTVILRGFEFTLREAIVFRGTSHSHGKKGAPQVKVTAIGEQKVPVNVTLYGGTQHKAELTVGIPPTHTSATVNAARHIDITYTLVVKALMGTGKPVSMELPVIVSNWPKSVSVEAMRRIGTAPNVSLPGGTMHIQAAPPASPALQPSPPAVQPISPQPDVKVAPSLPHARSSASSNKKERPATADSTTTRTSSANDSSNAGGKYTTAPIQRGNGYDSKVDEFGLSRATSSDKLSGQNSSGYGVQTIGGTGFGGASSGGNSSGARRTSSYTSEAAVPRPRNNSGREIGSGMRLTAMNLNEQELKEQEEEGVSNSRQMSAQGPKSAGQGSRSGHSRWLTAEEEKQRLYESAVRKVEEAQGLFIPREEPVEHKSSLPTKKATSKWLTAEEEKARLFNEAQAAVARAQGLVTPDDVSAPSITGHGRNGSLNGHAVATPPQSASKSQFTNSRPTTANSTAGSRPTPTKVASIQYTSAHEEKAALRRYEEAQAAVARAQLMAAYGASSSAHDAPYSDYPTTPRSALAAPQASPPLVQPAVSSPSPYMADAHNASISAVGLNGTSGHADQPMSSAMAEKEMLRRRLEAQDAAALAATGPPHPPPRNTPRAPSSHGSRPIPVPPSSPTFAGGSRPLTAAEEKARLKALWDAEDQPAQPNGTGHPPSAPNGIYASDSLPEPELDVGPPPPLMPKPPKEYIDETQEEDKRTFAQLEAMDHADPERSEIVLSSFNAGLVDSYGNPLQVPGSPPRLSHKVLIE